MQFNGYTKKYSDHYMLVTDLKIKPPPPKRGDYETFFIEGINIYFCQIRYIQTMKES